MTSGRRRGGLKHLPFFGVIASEAEGSPRARSAVAGLLVLRFIDHWLLVGPAIVAPDSMSSHSVRKAILALPHADPGRRILLNIVNAMQALKFVNLEPILPRLDAYGLILRNEAWAHDLAADVADMAKRLREEQEAPVVRPDLRRALELLDFSPSSEN